MPKPLVIDPRLYPFSSGPVRAVASSRRGLSALPNKPYTNGRVYKSRHKPAVSATGLQQSHAPDLACLDISATASVDYAAPVVHQDRRLPLRLVRPRQRAGGYAFALQNVGVTRQLNRVMVLEPGLVFPALLAGARLNVARNVPVSFLP